MAIVKLALSLSTIFLVIQYISGHAKMVDPMSRASVWRLKKYDDVPTYYEDNQIFCGGYGIQHGVNQGKCGPCGDAYDESVPRRNENGGYFGKGHVVKSYRSGEKARVTIEVNTNHNGSFTFSMCELSSPVAVETEECFELHPLEVLDDSGRRSDRYNIGDKKGLVNIDVFLPQGLKCDRCVMRWQYTTGNFWGYCDGPEMGEDRHGEVGCGPQENYRNCADVSIE